MLPLLRTIQVLRPENGFLVYVGATLLFAPVSLPRLEAAHPGDDSLIPFFFEFLQHPAPDEWTDSLLLPDRHAEITVPSLTIAGWHDVLRAADLENLQARDR
jgi:predicted acyl esterase